jgi:hypothetical protein
MIPANEWWSVIQNYNLTVFPAQIVFYVLATISLLIFIYRGERLANRTLKVFFILAFSWIGGVFFLQLGQDLPAHNVQSTLFLSLAGLFALDLITNTTQFKLPRSGWRQIATMLDLVAIMLGYPLVGILQRHPVSKLIIPGTFPCPTTALALVFMATTFPSKRLWLYLITLSLLLIWAIPFPIMIQIPKFGAYEDGIMLAIGLYSLLMLVINWKETTDQGTAPSSSPISSMIQ